MAIYQYTLFFIPRLSILERYQNIPEQLFIDFGAWEEHWQKESLESPFEFEDALTIDWWEARKVSFKTLEPVFNTFLKSNEAPQLFTNNIVYGNFDTNDLCVGINENSYIEDITCRIDLRNVDKTFIENIYLLANKGDCMLLDKKGNLFEPSFVAILKNIKKSNSFKFVLNPEDFLAKISSGEIKPE